MKKINVLGLEDRILTLLFSDGAREKTMFLFEENETTLALKDDAGKIKARIKFKGVDKWLEASSARTTTVEIGGKDVETSSPLPITEVADMIRGGVISLLDKIMKLRPDTFSAAEQKLISDFCDQLAFDDFIEYEQRI